jgi:signal transduction histidine kinase
MFVMPSLLPAAPDEHLSARRILAVTEEELRRIVLDIHDGPVQQLFAALSQISLMQARRARGEAIADGEWDDHLQRLSGLLGVTLHEIRNFLGTFRPPEFARRELPEILQGLILQHEAFTGCEVELRVEAPARPLALPVKIALYRICQEALANAFRHSGSQRQRVRLAYDEGMVVLEVSDDGRGFEPPPLIGPDATEREEHIGLRGMRDRVGLVGGEIELDSAPGRGTRITVRVPPL